MDKYRLHNNVQEGYRQLFSNHQYDIMVTLRFEYESYRGRNVLRHLQEFVRNLAKLSKDQVAGYSVVNTFKHPHVHLLLFGNKQPLAKVTTSVAESLWRYGSADVRRVLNEGAAFYTALNITPHAQDQYGVYFHNTRLLKRRGRESDAKRQRRKEKL